ncbi:MAG TPA: DNA polymerase III subunit gamma/tau [Gammaproteobacteria bacterium]|nr:DNA polymerase III subunit gamma/tau [Gammaproteobacteria bacterium]
MSYLVLARKWRPRTFQEMIGQDTTLRILANAIEQKRIHHAYLLTGTHGVGKTTLARILAKCLNCEINITSTPCGTCYACQAIDNGQFLDLFEIDAASRTKIEDTRELLDNVLYPPTHGRYKIYLIDEAHMLSNHSFNALLKTLEEPPEHIKFLLATTDPKRLPNTILSRCLQFHLKQITPEQITKHLQHICHIENIQHEIVALETLAQAANGSMRDALSLLDQAIAYGLGVIQKNDITTMLGSISQNDLWPLLEAIATQDGKRLFNIVSQLADRAVVFQQVLDEIIHYFHKITMTQIVPELITDHHITSLAKLFTPEDIQLYYQIALLGRRDLPFAPSPQQGFEMTMLRILAFKPNSMLTKNSTISTIESEKVLNQETSFNLPPWRELLAKLELTGMSYALASNCTFEKFVGNKFELALSNHHKPMLNQKSQDRIAEALNRYLKKVIKLDIHLSSEELITPLKQQSEEQEVRLAHAKETVMQDSQVKKLLEMYDATVEVSLV